MDCLVGPSVQRYAAGRPGENNASPRRSSCGWPVGGPVLVEPALKCRANPLGTGLPLLPFRAKTASQHFGGPGLSEFELASCCTNASSSVVFASLKASRRWCKKQAELREAIYIVTADGGLSEAPRTPYSLEAELQELVAAHPDLLAGDQIDRDRPRRWRLIRREAPVGSATARARWSLDHLFVDQDATPTLVEAKRGGNPEARREVVAQLLEYAANGTLYWPLDDLRSWFEQQFQGDNDAAARSIGELTGTADIDAEGYDDFWRRVGENLRERRVRLIFVADEIPSELKTLVEFLNEQMSIDVLAIEIAQYADGHRKLLRPQLVGQTERARAKPDSAGPIERPTPWSEAEILDQIASDLRPRAAEILDWAHRQPDMVVAGNQGYSHPHLSLFVQGANGTRICILRVRVNPEQFVAVPFKRMTTHPPFTDQAEKQRLFALLQARGFRINAEDAAHAGGAYLDEVHLNANGGVGSLLQLVESYSSRLRMGR